MSTNIDPILEEAAEEAEELMRAMEDCGFDGCCGECPLEAIDALHKRVVDSFYREPIQA